MAWKLFGGSQQARMRAKTRVPERIGLALGGGAVRGAAHVGVLAVLDAVGIKPDVIAGTSAGSVAGAAYAAGATPAEMLAILEKTSWPKLVVPAWHSKLSAFETGRLGLLIESLTHCATFAELEIPFAAVACDLLTGKRVDLVEGQLREAVIASTCIPGVFEPVRRDGMLLVDGGLVDNVPVDTARMLGADYVIAVDVMPTLDGTHEPVDMRDVIMLVLSVSAHQTGQGVKEADVVIRPDVMTVSALDFGHVGRAYAAGVLAAEAALPKILADLGRAG
ncbi:MAG: patatin [Coriobacteriia bacterium]|nr:patatin [Coriobacteriia bacterium]